MAQSAAQVRFEQKRKLLEPKDDRLRRVRSRFKIDWQPLATNNSRRLDDSALVMLSSAPSGFRSFLVFTAGNDPCNSDPDEFLMSLHVWSDVRDVSYVGMGSGLGRPK
jgi:hypothetical protein